MRLREAAHVGRSIAHRELADAKAFKLHDSIVNGFLGADGHKGSCGPALNSFAKGLPFLAKESALAHPIVVVDFTHIAAAVVVK